MKKSSVFFIALVCAVASYNATAQTQNSSNVKTVLQTEKAAETEQEKKAGEWATELKLNDPAKEARVKTVIAAHLTAIRDWNNTHPFTTVPAGINPLTGVKLSELDRQIIANSAMPESIHQDLMAGLKKDLSEDQVELVLDKYTIGKVAFTMNGYKAIVPNLTAEEEAKILGFLKQAREQAVDYKSMKQISAIFEIYKTRSEQYLNSNGRSWKEMYKAYTDGVKAKKAADKAAAEKAKAPAL